MERNQKQPDSELKSHSPSEDSSTENNETSHEQEYLELEQTRESAKETLVDEEPISAEKSSGGKKWFFLLALFIALGTGTYFYLQENGINTFEKFPWNLKIPSLATPKTPNSLDIKSKKLPNQLKILTLLKKKSSKMKKRLICYAKRYNP